MDMLCERIRPTVFELLRQGEIGAATAMVVANRGAADAAFWTDLLAPPIEPTVVLLSTEVSHESDRDATGYRTMGVGAAADANDTECGKAINSDVEDPQRVDGLASMGARGSNGKSDRHS
jgi:hypothetical protein